MLRVVSTSMWLVLGPRLSGAVLHDTTVSLVCSVQKTLSRHAQLHVVSQSEVLGWFYNPNTTPKYKE